MLEKILESPLDCKEIKPVNPKGNQPWIFIGRTDAEAPILWPPDMKSRLFGKYPDVGKDWGQKEKGVSEDEMVRQHQQLNGHESEQTLGDGEGQGSQVCCSPGGVAKSWTWLSNRMAHFALRCCVSFCCTAKWISYTYTYSPSFFFPFRSPQSIG